MLEVLGHSDSQTEAGYALETIRPPLLFGWKLTCGTETRLYKPVLGAVRSYGYEYCRYARWYNGKAHNFRVCENDSLLDLIGKVIAICKRLGITPPTVDEVREFVEDLSHEHFLYKD